MQSEIGQIGVSCHAEFNRFLDVYGVKERFIGGDKGTNGHMGRSENIES